MENTPEESDDGEEEDWMAIDWNGCLPSEIKRGHSNNGEGVIKQSSLGTERQQNDDSEEITSEDKVHREPLMSRMLLNDNKAGMSGLDKDRINQIILEASKGSKYFENERKKEEQVTKRIEEQRQKMKIITPEQLEIAEKEADLLLEDFDRLRDLSKTIVHVDMDAFYAAVEMRDNPSLRDKPMAVGGNSMLSTSNYHARKFGVRAAMPGFIGKKLCPELVIVPLHFDKYTAVSKQVKEILGTFDPNFCSVSLDEAYLDLTEHVMKRQGLSAKERSIICRLCDSFDKNCCLCDLNETVGMTCCEDGSVKVKNTSTNICDTCRKPIPEFELVTFGTTVEEAVKEMRCRIQQKTCLTASAGIAPNMMLAKVCSDMNKPNGQYLIPSTVEDVMSFIRNLPIRKISGIGKVSERMLNAVGVKTCQELYDKRGLLYHLYSQISFNYFMRICLGIGSTTVERDGERKSMSTERTFSEISAPTELYSKCLELCHSLAEDLQEEELKGKTVTIKIKTVKFDVKTRACSIPDYTNDAEVIFIAAKDLLCKEIKNVHPQPLQLRLMGVRMSSLVEQTLVSSKVQQNTLLQFVRKGEKVGKHEMQQNKEKCFQKESGVDAQILCSEKTDQSTDEQNSHVNASDTHINHCDNYKKKSSEQDGKQEIESKNLETKAEISEIEGASNTDLPGYESERRPVSDKGNSQEMEDKPDSVWYTCPVCRDEVGCTDLHAFNHHIDSCLSRSVVKECSRYQQEPGNSKNKGTSSRKTVTPKRKAASSKQVKTSVKTPHKSSGAVKTQDLNCSVKQKTSLNPTASKSIEIPSESSSNGLKMNTSSNSSNEPSGDAIKELPSCANRETLVCPVCFMEQTGVDLDAFNRHVDSCLCKGTITEILKEQRHSYKRPLEKQGTPGQGGKRKRQESGPKCSTSIASFFQMNS